MKTTLELQFHFWYLNSFIKQSTSEMHRLQTDILMTPFKLWGNHFATCQDVQSHLQTLNLHCIKISPILQKKKSSYKEMEPRALI